MQRGYLDTPIYQSSRNKKRISRSSSRLFLDLERIKQLMDVTLIDRKSSAGASSVN